MKKLSIAAAGLGLFLFFAPQALAAGSLAVVINEIAWMGSKVEGIESKNWWRYEWLELYNNSESEISLDGWTIELYRTQLDWKLELNKSIPAKAYYLIVASDKISSDFDLNYANLSGKLVNTGQKIILKDNTGQIIDEVDCLSGWFTGDNNTKQTMERISPNLSGPDPANWQNSQNPGGTPKTKNSKQKTEDGEQKTESPEEGLLTPSGADEKENKILNYPIGVLFNEILPSPEGPDEQNEWIEIYNQNNFAVDLTGWKIEDASGKTVDYVLPQNTKIMAYGFLLLGRPQTKITLNNKSDGLKLSSPDNKIVDQVSYQKAPLGQSYNKTGSGWIWSPNLTPGKTNVIPEQKPKEIGLSPEDQSLKNNGFSDTKGLAMVSSGAIKSLTPFLISLLLAVASGIVILFLKRNLSKIQ